MNIRTIITLSAALSIGLIAPVSAQENLAQARISYRDIDVNTVRGQRILALRIHRAANALCDSADERLDSKARQTADQCRTQVKRDAQIAINAQSTVKFAHR
jgi:UrcA family protein